MLDLLSNLVIVAGDCFTIPLWGRLQAIPFAGRLTFANVLLDKERDRSQ
jgi:hypothetical protein